MLTPAPHQSQPTLSRTTASPKRNRISSSTDELSAATPHIHTLQTSGSGFSTPTRRRKCSIDDSVSPRTAVSNKFHRLGIHSNLSPTRSSWTANLITSSSLIPDGAEIPRSSPTTMSTMSCDNNSMVIEETPENSICGTTHDSLSSDEEAEIYASVSKETAHKVFHFGAGIAARSAMASPAQQAFPSKRARFESAEYSSPEGSPAKRRRTSPSPPANIKLPISTSPSPPPPLLSPSPIDKRQIHSPRPNDQSDKVDNSSSEVDEVDPDIAEFWWQPSEITGHTPEDPDEDNYGVNGIGYQKTKAEAWHISQKKKKQIAEWRSREAREARALRAGGRKSMAGAGVATGRVTKSGSRSGSPVAAESGRRSPFSPRKEREERIARAVRFEIG